MRKNFLFYLGHLFLGAYFVTLAQGRSGAVHFLLIVAIFLYVIALLRAGSHYREEMHHEKNENEVCIGFGEYVKGVIEHPYTFVVTNHANHVKEVLFDPHDEIDIQGTQEISSGVRFYPSVISLMEAIKNNPKKYCFIEIYATGPQLGLPVTHTHQHVLDGNKQITSTLKHEAVGESYKSYYCNILLRKGNNLGFMMLPNSTIVVKLHPYRTID